MYLKLESCPLCHNGYFDNYMICKDHQVSGESFAIVECSNCKLKFTNPRPGPENIVKYYVSDSYDSHSTRIKSLYGVIYRIARYFNLKNKIKLVGKFAQKGTILDVGCGTGEFLQTAGKSGWNTVGMEPNPKAREYAQKLTGSIIHQEISDISQKKYFDAITLWHVLEHVDDLKGTIKRLKKLLKREGKLIIAVPNCESYEAGVYKEMWAGYDVPRHFYHFTKSSMDFFQKEFDLKLKKVLPLKLDALYVSLLSEKSKNRSSSLTNSLGAYFKALRMGIRSNREAGRSNNYSSLIYVFTKK